MRSSAWSSDVCSSDLLVAETLHDAFQIHGDERLVLDDEHVGCGLAIDLGDRARQEAGDLLLVRFENGGSLVAREALHGGQQQGLARARRQGGQASLGNRLAAVAVAVVVVGRRLEGSLGRSEEHTSELQSLMRISY